MDHINWSCDLVKIGGVQLNIKNQSLKNQFL